MSASPKQKWLARLRHGRELEAKRPEITVQPLGADVGPLPTLDDYDRARPLRAAAFPHALKEIAMSVKDEHDRYIYEPTEMWTVRMSPVYSNEPGHENKAFWDATPSGAFEFGTVNKAAVESLQLGAEY